MSDPLPNPVSSANRATVGPMDRLRKSSLRRRRVASSNFDNGVLPLNNVLSAILQLSAHYKAYLLWLHDRSSVRGGRRRVRSLRLFWPRYHMLHPDYASDLDRIARSHFLDRPANHQPARRLTPTHSCYRISVLGQKADILV